MATRRSFAIDEWYHCFNRGIDKRAVFGDEYDAKRFLMLLYLANSTEPVDLFRTRKPNLKKAYDIERGQPLVSIGAFCLMPNHYHLLLKEIIGDGITSFMRKVGTAYTMYFNQKNERIGNLFLKPFRSRHITTDRYFQRVLQYIHCNPAELSEPNWKSGKVRNIHSLEKKLVGYPYSSLFSFVKRGEASPILSADVFETANHPSVSRMLTEARAYYTDNADELKLD